MRPARFFTQLPFPSLESAAAPMIPVFRPSFAGYALYPSIRTSGTYLGELVKRTLRKPGLWGLRPYHQRGLHPGSLSALSVIMLPPLQGHCQQNKRRLV